MVITFCGHGKINIENQEKERLENIIIDLLKKYDNIDFYLGGYGNFDNLCYGILKKLKGEYDNFKMIFITPYLSDKYEKLKTARDFFDEIIYPPLENVPKKYAILERNKWIVKKSDLIIACVKYSFGGAKQTFDYAVKLKKKIINITLKEGTA